MAKDDDTLKGKAALDEIGTRLGGLFETLKGAVDEIAQKVQATAEQARERAQTADPNAATPRREDAGATARARGGARTATQEIKIETPAGPIAAMAGWSVKVGGLAAGTAGGAADGAAEPDDFEVKKPTTAPHGAEAAAAVRAAEVEVYEEADAWVATVELPGATVDDVTLSAEPGRLVVETIGARRFRAVAALPESLDPERVARDAETRLSNGILEIRLATPSGSAGDAPANRRAGSETPDAPAAPGAGARSDVDTDPTPAPSRNLDKRV